MGRGRGVDRNSLSRGELDTPAIGTSWKVGGKGEKPTFLAVFEPVGPSNDDTGDDTGGVSVDSWRFEGSDASSSASSSWPFFRNSRASFTCSRSSLSLVLSFGGVGGCAGSEVNSEEDEGSIVFRNSNKSRTLSCCRHVGWAETKWEMSRVVVSSRGSRRALTKCLTRVKVATREREGAHDNATLCKRGVSCFKETRQDPES